MSDIPELDRLIEEHENYRRNVWWNRQDAMFYAMCRFQIAALISLPLALIIGPIGLAVIPFVWSWARSAFPSPPPRDPFRRYKAM